MYILFRRSGAHPYDTLLYTSPPSGSTPFSASSSATVTIVVTGDVSGDGKITITDVVQAAQVTVGQRTIG